jgi:hypothetical protein
MRQIQMTLLIGILSLTIQGQNFSTEFGKIGIDEFELNEYALDKDAEAVVLFDKGKSYFIRMDDSFDVGYVRTTRIKILSESGVKWAEVEIPLYHKNKIYESLFDVEAYTYNYENGRIIKTKFNISNTYDEKINEYWSVRKFAIPNVKKGSIIEYTYSIYSQYKFNFRNWEFQWEIPVVYSEYEVNMIPYYEYATGISH